MPGASCLSTTAKARAGRREPEIWTFLALRAYLNCPSFGESRYLPSIPLDWPRIAFHKRLGGFSRGTVAAPRPLMNAVTWAHPVAPVSLWLHGAPCFDWICWISAPFLFITSSYGRHGISCCARETPSLPYSDVKCVQRRTRKVPVRKTRGAGGARATTRQEIT